MQFTNNEKSLEFITFLKTCIKEKFIDVVAEEWNTEITKNIRTSDPSFVVTNVVKAADQYGIRVVEIDPTNEERSKLYGYRKINRVYRSSELAEKRKTIKDNFEPREREWLRRLRPYFDKSVLLVCGDDHVPSLSKKFFEQGVECVVVSSGKWMSEEDVLAGIYNKY